MTRGDHLASLVQKCQRMGLASSYIRSRQGAQTTTEGQLFNQAKTLADKTMMETKEWMDKIWKPYVADMKAVEVNLWE